MSRRPRQPLNKNLLIHKLLIKTPIRKHFHPVGKPSDLTVMLTVTILQLLDLSIL